MHEQISPIVQSTDKQDLKYFCTSIHNSTFSSEILTSMVRNDICKIAIFIINGLTYPLADFVFHKCSVVVFFFVLLLQIPGPPMCTPAQFSNFVDLFVNVDRDRIEIS